MFALKLGFFILFLSSFTVYADITPSLGSQNEANIAEVAGALGDDETAESLEEDCDCEENGMVSENSENEEQEQDEPIELFFNLQFMLSSENGERMASTAVPSINVQSAIRDYAKLNGLDEAGIDALSESELREIFGTAFGPLGAQAREDAISNALIMFEISKMEGATEQEMLAAVAARMQGQSFQRKIGLIANFLGNFASNYNNAMLDDYSLSNDVRLPEMMGAIRTSYLTDMDIDEGVCRHMHHTAVRLAQAMGLSNAFGIGYRTGDTGHRTIIVSDPEDPRKMVQLNYGRATEVSGVNGPAALAQNHTIPDNGIRFRIYNGEGAIGMILPSDKGAILNQVTGGTDSDLNPLYQSTAQIQQVGINTPYGTVRFFRGQAGPGTLVEADGEEVIGGSYNVHVDYDDVFYGEYGIAGFYNQRQVEAGQQSGGGVYAQTTQGFNWTFFESDDIDLTAFGEINLRGTLYCSGIEGNECEFNYDYDIGGNAGLQANFQTGPVDHTTTLQTQLQLEPAQGAALGGASPQLVAPVTSLSHDMIFEISPDVSAQLGGGIHFVTLGPENNYFLYNADGSLSINSTGTSFGVSTQGAITPGTPTFLPGAAQMGTANINQSLLDGNLNIGVTGSVDFNNAATNNYVGVQLQGTFD